MKTQLSSDNPFVDRPTWAYAYESIRDGFSILDYGCFEGEFIDRLANARRVSVCGVDKNADAIARYKGPHEIKLIDKTIPYSDDVFDMVTIFDVLEHIHDQLSVLREIRRVLKPGGLLIVTVPRHHIFSALDMSNWKFVFPKIHKFLYTLRFSAEQYNYRYVECANGLIGDIEKEKAWHQHFRDPELLKLLADAGFKVENIDGYGQFGHVMTLFSTFGIKIFPDSLRRLDNYKFETREFACRFSKPS